MWRDVCNQLKINPPPLIADINDPFKALDFTDLPPLWFILAADGMSLTFREYPPDPTAIKESTVLVSV